LTLTWKGGQGRVEIGAKKGTDYYARSSDSPAIFTLAGCLVTDMQALLKLPAKPADNCSAKTTSDKKPSKTGYSKKSGPKS